jgi:hypothetical protein
MQQDKNRISDPKIIQHVSQRLGNRGIRSPARINVASANGQVTLSGTIQYEHQRHTALRTAQSVEGVSRVVDMLKLIVAEPKPMAPTPRPSPRVVIAPASENEGKTPIIAPAPPEG